MNLPPHLAANPQVKTVVRAGIGIVAIVHKHETVFFGVEGDARLDVLSLESAFDSRGNADALHMRLFVKLCFFQIRSSLKH